MPTDDERKEILKLLYLLKEYAERRGGEEGSPTRVAYINRYISEYSKHDPNVKQSNFIDLHDPKEEASDPKNTVRVYMKSKFLPFINAFFETEGKELRYRLTFPERGYSLILKENPFWSEGPEPKETPGIEYIEHIYFRTQYRPILIALVLTVVYIICGFLFIKGITTYLSRGNLSSLIVGLMISVVAAFFFFLGKALARVSDYDTLAFFIWKKFFFKRLDKSLMLTSYESLCPLCGGKVILTDERKKNIGYIAKCQRNTEHHKFSCDYVLLTGKLLSP